MRYICKKEFDSRVTLDGYTCVTTMVDLYRAIGDSNAELIRFNGDFVDEFFTRSSMATLIESIKELNPNVKIESEFESFLSPIGIIKSIYGVESSTELHYLIEANPKAVIDTIKTLCESYIDKTDESLTVTNKISSQHLKIASLQKEVKDLEKELGRRSEQYNDASRRLDILIKRINAHYDKGVDESKMLDAEGNRYDKVLYIKEISRVHFTDTLIYYVQEIIRSIYATPCRLCVLEPFGAHNKSVLYPGLKPSWSLSVEDAYKSDIFMAGFQPTLMTDILKNASNVRYLIILDRLGDLDTHVAGSNVEELYTLSDSNEMNLFSSILNDRFITYSNSTLTIPYIKGFDTLSAEERMKEYSSLPITKGIIQLLER